MKSNTCHFVGVLCVFIFVVVTASGCQNTANGAGKDIEKMGEQIQEKTR